ncbi:hypothetical protein MMC16_002994 [Acarospora aff. strigata]|nr:hypothetical protein [Acarospora aff. strigata]
MPVEKGDVIFVPADKLGEKKLVVEWSQMMQSRKESTSSVFTTTRLEELTSLTASEPENQGMIFVQANMLDDFKKKHTEGDQYTITVDDSFQYGQDKEKKKRWLCFHNKNDKPYQHRFVESTIVKYGNAAAGFAVGQGYKDVNTVADVIKHFAGDYLHNF